MSLYGKQFESVDENDLLSLVDNQVIERKTLEYKESLPGNSDSEKREFLADVSSFANGSGGHLILGIRETDGVPTELAGLEIANLDSEKLRLENIIRDGVEPRIPGVGIREIPLKNKKVAIVIRVPRSWALPHMVTFKAHSRFYSRNSAGKYPLDVSEIRALFALSETTTERIRNFRVERLARIVARETPIVVNEGPKMVLHIIPLNAFDPAARFDVSPLGRNIPRPMYTSSWDGRINFDGFLSFRKSHDSPSARTYLQVFRNGSIEAVETLLLRASKDSGHEERLIPSVAYEKELLDALPRFLDIQRQLGVEPPLFVMLSLLDVADYAMAVDHSRFYWHDDYPIDRDSLLIPEVIVEGFRCDHAEVMRPIFDAVWNAAGWPRSMNYDEKGKWKG